MVLINQMSKKILIYSTILFLFACGGGIEKIPVAEVAVDSNFALGDYTAYLSTNKTNDLSDQMAKKYGLERRKNLAMLNVSILRNSDWKSIDAKIELHVKNLIGQNKKVDKFTIKENGAISNSFISPISNQETLLYSLAITVKDQGTNKIENHKKYNLE